MENIKPLSDFLEQSSTDIVTVKGYVKADFSQAVVRMNLDTFVNKVSIRNLIGFRDDKGQLLFFYTHLYLTRNPVVNWNTIRCKVTVRYGPDDQGNRIEACGYAMHYLFSTLQNEKLVKLTMDVKGVPSAWVYKGIGLVMRPQRGKPGCLDWAYSIIQPDGKQKLSRLEYIPIKVTLEFLPKQ